MFIFSVILFFLYAYGFGFGLGSLAKESEDFIEKHLMRIGIGLAVFPVIGLLLNILRIPLDWRIFLGISLLPFAVYFFKRRKLSESNFKAPKINLYAVLMLLLFAVTLFMYVKGAFVYPYLEDDDSWNHAIGVKYVSVEKTVFSPGPNKNVNNYLDPYPPSYDLILGVLHQTNDSMYLTLKFFNALIISLGIIFFYFFAKSLTSSSMKALLSTFALFSVPAFLSHFIWALALAVPLYFVSFYAIEKIKADKKWAIIAAVVSIAALTSTPTHSTYFGLLLVIYFAARFIIERRLIIYEIIAAASSLILSVLLWWLPVFLRHDFNHVLVSLGIGGPNGNASPFSIQGTGDRIYTFSDFFYAKSQNMINNPIGIGVVLSILAVLGILFLIFRYKEMLKKENYHKLLFLLWFAFAFYSVNAARFYFKLSPFRAWMILAIPVSLLAGEAMFYIFAFSKSLAASFSGKKIGTFAGLLVLALIIYGVISTSFAQKYAVNTANWPPGAFWTSFDEINGYVWMKDNIPKNSRVYNFVNSGPIVGMDMFNCRWCESEIEYKKIGFNQSAAENHNWLKKERFGYLIIDGQTVRQFGQNISIEKIRDITESGYFKPVFSNNGIIIFSVA
ncbi:MAG TPA: hypothetical protein VI564_06930 [Candidatus Nanoarchaeia archaeon]|nr:hypothetical protein [Candidatus Nanoarchaeia archaeon]